MTTWCPWSTPSSRGTRSSPPTARRGSSPSPATRGCSASDSPRPIPPPRPAFATRRARSLVSVSRTYEVRTYGCQMNVHDSERISGLLDQAGYVPAQPDSTPDVVVFNTCAVRENADNRLYGNLGHLKPVKDAT